MINRRLALIVPILAVAAAGAALFWLTRDNITVRPVGPGEDGAPTSRKVSQANVFSSCLFTTGDGKPSGIEGAWPRFRGADLDGISKDKTPLLRQWPAGGPTQLWSVEMGAGYAGAAVANGRVYVLDHIFDDEDGHEKNNGDALRCLSLDDGKEIWRCFYPIMIKPDHGISRSVPTVASNYVVTIGPKCHVMCCDATTGDFKWGKDLVKDWGAKWPGWYSAQCPLVDHGKAIIATGGKALLIAVDLPTGDVVWESENPRNWKMTHSSIVPMKLDGEEMYVYCASGGIVGVSAATGKILWEYDGWQDTTQNVPMPVMLGDGRFLVSVSYKPGMPKRIGAMVVQLAKEGAQYTAKPVATIQQDEFASEQQTPVFYNGNIFCVRSPAGIGQLICTDLVGKTLWTSGEDRFGIGPYMIVDGVILAMDDNGVLSMIEASASGYKRLARAKVASNESWAPMALVDGRLIVRDITKMYCVDLRGKQKN